MHLVFVAPDASRSGTSKGPLRTSVSPRLPPTWTLATVKAPLPPYALNDVGVLDLDGDVDRGVVVASWRLPSEQGYTGTFRGWRNVGGD